MASPRIIIIDYEMGNLASVRNALRAVGYSAEVSSDPADIAVADGLFLPGVGAFGTGMHHLRERGLVGPIQAAAAAGRPILGICLGMQLLFEVGEESGTEPGLGLLTGRVSRLPASVKLPQMGWNQVELSTSHPIFAGLPASFYAYYDHSYAAEGIDPQDLVAVTEYGRRYPAVVAKSGVVGIQFHPEKSAEMGLQILQNWGRYVWDSRSTRPLT